MNNTANVIKVGTKVKVNVEALTSGGWEGLTPADNFENKDNKGYILEHEEKEYLVKEILDTPSVVAKIVLDDEFLSATSFRESELIVCEEVIDVLNVRKCNRCHSIVGKSQLDEYSYSCDSCDEDLYGIETYVTMKTKHEFLEEEKEAMGERDYNGISSKLDNDYYEMVEQAVKAGGTISQAVYDSLSDGQRFHFNKHYNHRNDKVQN